VVPFAYGAPNWTPVTGAWDASNLLLMLPSSAVPPDSGPPAPTGSTVAGDFANQIVMRKSTIVLNLSLGKTVVINPPANITNISTPVTTGDSVSAIDGSSDSAPCDCSPPTDDGSDPTVDTTPATDTTDMTDQTGGADVVDPSGFDTPDVSSDSTDASDTTDPSTTF
jgi:hypothetical protein